MRHFERMDGETRRQKVKEKLVAKAIITAGAVIVVCIAFFSLSALTGAFAAERPKMQEVITCIPLHPRAKIALVTDELKIEWRRRRLELAIQTGAKLPFIRSASEFELIKPVGLSKQDEAALKDSVLRTRKAVKK